MVEKRKVAREKVKESNMKKGYVRTELFKFLNKVEKENGKPLTVQDVFEQLPKLYEFLQSNPENELQGLDFPQFRQLAELGYMIGQQKAMFGV